MAAQAKVLLALEVELLVQVRRDGRVVYLSGSETHNFPMDYGCFDTIEHIWGHIGRSLYAYRSSAVVEQVESIAWSLCCNIQAFVHECMAEAGERANIQVPWTVSLYELQADDDIGQSLDVYEPSECLPASKSSVASLKRKKSGEEEEKEKEKDDEHESEKVCAVCQDELGTDGGACVATLPCSHEYHEECILEWLKRAHSCPLCRFKLPTD